jgi:hypothetical protein
MRGSSAICGRSLAITGLVLSSLLVDSLPAAAAVTPPWDPYFAVPTIAADVGSSARPFGVAAGDFDGDDVDDLMIGRTTGNVAFVKGNGDGSFAAPVQFGWKQAFFNTWAFASADVNGDDHLDVVWGASAASSGCSIPGPGCTVDVFVDDGDVRVWYGNGDGTFQQNAYDVSGVLFNAGTLLGRVATDDAGSVAAGDIDDDGDADVVAGAVDGTDAIVRLLRNNGPAGFAMESLIDQPTAISGDLASPTYFPAVSTQSSPWGLAFGDADGDGDLDLFVGDRALYIYLYLNDGSGGFTLQTPNTVLPARPNVYLRHDTHRAAAGYTPSLAAGDINGDGTADLAVGVHSGTQTPASGVVNDGLVLLNVSTSTGHVMFGPVADVGTMARGLGMFDADRDDAVDMVAATYEGQVKILRQLPPIDTDGDGVSDYVDNAPLHVNAARLDMNSDGSINSQDQLDNDFDTVLGDPVDPGTWIRLGDPADPDDDNDGVLDTVDDCVFVSDAGQTDRDSDGVGDACDPLDDRDPDGDGIPTGFLPGDALYEVARAAAGRWSEGDTHFVIRIDALSRFFQNEFTQLMVDAGTLDPDDWAAKCWENYGPGGGDPPDPCGLGEGTPGQLLTLGGGVGVPITIVTIPNRLWTDPPVIDWINDRNDNPLFDLGQHGTYHTDNTPLGDWAPDPTRNFYSCETCGLTPAENFELLKVGYDTLLGDYTNLWSTQSGATAASPKIDWSTSANPLISYAPPHNASDAASREATAHLGFRSFSASRAEEDPAALGDIFSPEGNWHETIDQFGMFHASADRQIDPEDLDMTDAEYEAHLNASTEIGGLNTWLIEEVEWSGRAVDLSPRTLANRENNTVYLPRWDRWIQLLEFIRDYPSGVAMTQGEVALANSFDNAPSVFNPDQADSDHDGIGDVIDGGFMPLPVPVRLADTRPGGTTIDGQVQGIGVRPAGSSLEVPVAGRAGVPVDASVVVLTVAAVNPVADGFLTVHADGTQRPNASNLNHDAADNTANTVIVPVGANGSVSIYTFASTQLIVDVSGYLPTGTYSPLPTAARLADTRPGGTTIDGQDAGDGIVGAQTSQQLRVAGRAGVPVDASAAVLTLTAVAPVAAGFFTVHARGTQRPNASNLNHDAADNTANTVIARIGAGGDVCVFTFASSHIVVDVSGFFTGQPPPAAGPTCPT